MKREVKADPFIFRNSVSGADYEWVKGKDGQPYLVMQEAPGIGVSVKELHPGLFREFARLQPTREAIQTFANEYGDLFNFWQDSPGEDGTLIWGTPLGTWKEKIGEMRILVDLWVSIQNQKIDELKKVITLTEEGPWYTLALPHRTSASLAYENTPSSPHEPIRFTPIQFAPRDVVLPARCALQLEINKRLAKYSTVPLLTWTPDTKETSGAYHQRIVFKPSNLLAAMWIQFAQAVTEAFQLRQCHCGRYFQVGPGGKRADSTTCSDVCRVNRWVEQKNQGKKKAAKGKARKSLR